MAAVVTACLTGTANAADGDSAISDAVAKRAVYEAHLANLEAAPVTAAEAAVYAETQTFKAAAEKNGETSDKISALLSSGDWVAYATETTTTMDDPGKPVVTAPGALLPGETAGADAGDAADPSDPIVALTKWCYQGNGPTVTVTAKNAAGAKLWYYQVGEQYCYNGRTVTNHDADPYVNHKVYTWAQALGWSWEGQDLTGKKGPSFYTWNNNAKGGLQTWRKGTMKYDPTHVEIGSFQKFPWVHLYERANGTYTYSGGY
ncbi:hypothetical protein GCM10010441_01610 [Kitasatospora paracochleata]|uniref:Uncharacterized protein n=1 Tax=Kitasatospora paracochleata TaxID=58354 RepID=A0ABT1J2X4_9ACTN|nr:hypothetical protein [Kitasatospora paracochleata]MCP2311718.1 hypothetical protein [Kitasatospora paracochleata]